MTKSPRRRTSSAGWLGRWVGEKNESGNFQTRFDHQGEAGGKRTTNEVGALGRARCHSSASFFAVTSAPRLLFLPAFGLPQPPRGLSPELPSLVCFPRSLGRLGCFGLSSLAPLSFARRGET